MFNKILHSKQNIKLHEHQGLNEVFIFLFVCLFVFFYLNLNVDEGNVGFMIYEKRDDFVFLTVNHTFLRTSISASSTHGESLSLLKCYCTVCLYRKYLREWHLSFKLLNLVNGKLKLHLRNSLFLITSSTYNYIFSFDYIHVANRKWTILFRQYSYVCFVDCCLSFCPVFRPLCCLFFDIRILTTPLVSSDSSCN